MGWAHRPRGSESAESGPRKRERRRCRENHNGGVDVTKSQQVDRDGECDGGPVRPGRKCAVALGVERRDYGFRGTGKERTGG